MITIFTVYLNCNKTPPGEMSGGGGSGMWREGVKGNGRAEGVSLHIILKCIFLQMHAFQMSIFLNLFTYACLV